ncbi:undecaprenyl-diphosphatase [Halanaerobium saccharolyticum]|uniref:Undecaprenyl-diphosphatase n=1 Tax=Halanaerobium saccharolyticum TaxID=43595 RepID=A0A4R6LCI6_9FIRM|nr:undecaprenyl-diphosphate phosphatase [Halanaerobium saccharolyticum]TDO71130.1 undecaprenyl-diphosphatase [Halanaerobium saccharolyticum]
MEIIKYLVVGVIQGITEFLPISSSGHIVLFKYFLDIKAGLTIDIFLHFGTLLAIFFVYYQDILNMIYFKDDYKTFNLYIIIGSIPAAVVGIFFEDFFEKMNSSLTVVGFFLIITGIILWLTNKITINKRKIKDMSVLDSIFIGLAQALAIFPGLSRSGSTIAAGLYKNLNRELATKFSFILSIPVIGGATLLKLKELTLNGTTDLNYFHLFLATISSMITGYLAINFFLKMIKEQKLHYFAYYCIPLGLILIFSL